MTRTKRILTVLLMAILSVMVALTFTACGGGEDNNGGGSSTNKYTVTEAQFNSALAQAAQSYFKTNVDVSTKINGTVAESETYQSTYVVTAKGIYVNQKAGKVDDPESQEIYLEKASDGYYAYAKVSGSWVKVDYSQVNYEGMYNNTVMAFSPAAGVQFPFQMYSYSESEKCYTFSQGGEGMSIGNKIFFENGKIVKTILIGSHIGEDSAVEDVVTTNTYEYNPTIQFPQVGGNAGGNTPEPEPEPDKCELTPTEWFDKDSKIFPKTLECSCGDASHKVTRSNIEIYTADDFIALAGMLNDQANIGTLKVEIKNDIDLEGAQIPALKAYDYQDRGRGFALCGAEGGITISNFTIVGDSALGLFGTVTSDLSIQNITINNMTIEADDEAIAGGFIGVYYPEDDATSARDIEIINCAIKNSTITAGTVGGIYGAAESELSEVRNIWIEKVTVEGCTLSGNLVGGIMGSAAYSYDKEVISISVNGYSLIGNTLTASVDNQAGLYVGILGTARIVFEYSPIGNEDKINNNTVTANGVANVTREYGRTGWASEADETYVWVAQSPMVSHFGQGVH